ncbi:DUF3951 domain-containing protein [Gracilibacillus massiliensis]|uniref:DUF3951 domain-containing protein n=1 Tax=Gracilibacillus massiliensis TaxID=1564956 RepID=UPI000AA0492C|nr:DUF3951 domain-containing protein [Gracilibacillus massiliensis]
MAIIFSIFVILVVSFGIHKMLSGKGTPDNRYTPYDHITGQSSTKFHEDKSSFEEQEDD